MITLLLTLFSLVNQPSTCDATLWQHVYHRQRLEVKVTCQEFTGVKQDATRGKRIDGCRHEADGDNHCWLRLDAGQESFINDENKKNQDGNLVYEPMCQHKVTQVDAKQACKGWAQQFTDIPVGAHVVLRGSLVLDTQHGHMECHPCEVVKVL